MPRHEQDVIEREGGGLAEGSHSGSYCGGHDSSTGAGRGPHCFKRVYCSRLTADATRACPAESRASETYPPPFAESTTTPSQFAGFETTGCAPGHAEHVGARRQRHPPDLINGKRHAARSDAERNRLPRTRARTQARARGIVNGGAGQIRRVHPPVGSHRERRAVRGDRIHEEGLPVRRGRARRHTRSEPHSRSRDGRKLIHDARWSDRRRVGKGRHGIQQGRLPGDGVAAGGDALGVPISRERDVERGAGRRSNLSRARWSADHWDRYFP